VRIEPSTVLGDGLTRDRLAATQVGEAMRVSGLRAPDGTIVATRVEAAAPGTRGTVTDIGDPGVGRFVVQGYVGEAQGQAVRVGATSFTVAPEIRAQLPRDRVVRLSGRTEAGERIVERADVLRSPFDVRPERILRSESRPSRESDERRSGRSGRDDDRSGRSGRDDDRSGRSGRDAERVDRSGRGGGDRPERVERPERPDRSGRSERPERVDRSGRR
jgi:hypothetical protein